MLLVVATAISSFAQGYSSTDRALIETIKNALQAIEQDTGTMITDVSGSKQTLDKIKLILDGLNRTISTLREDTIEQTQYLDGFSESLSSIIDQLRDLHQDLTTGGYDDSSVVSGIDSLSSKLTAMSSSLSQILSAINALDTVDSQTFLSGVADVVDAVDNLPDSSAIGSHFADVLLAIRQLEQRLDKDLTVTGEVEISGSGLNHLENTLSRFSNSFGEFYEQWRTILGIQGSNDKSWYEYVDSVRSFQSQTLSYLATIESMLSRVANLADYLTEAYPDYNNFYTNMLALYLPYLTNGLDSSFLNVLSNNLANIPLYPSDPAWTITGQNVSYYNLARFFGGLLSNQTHKDGYSVGTFIPGAHNDGLVRRFFQRGGPSQPSDFEKSFGQYSAQMDDQRRYIFSISNTVPYIEGLPYRKSSLSDDGDGWVSAWGNYNWNTDGDTISLTVDGRSGGHTPWNNQYFATDYFADLLKFLARTNLLQNAAYYDSVLAVLGVTNSVPPYDEIDPPEDLEWEEPSDVQKQLEELPDAEHILPTEFETVDSPEYSSFISGASDKLGYALNDPVDQQSDVITLFPRVPSIRSYSAVVPSPELLHFEDYMTASDRRTIHDIFAIIWRLIYYVFAVYKVTDLIKSFFVAS